MRIFLVFLLVLIAGPAYADDVIATVSGWSIKISEANSCYMMKDFPDKTQVGLFRDPEKRTFILTVTGQRWQSDVKTGVRYPIRLVMNDGQNWTGEAFGLRNAHRIGVLAIPSISAHVISELMQKSSVDMFNADNRIARISLTGSTAAMTAMNKCQRDADTPHPTAPPALRKPDLSSPPSYSTTPVAPRTAPTPTPLQKRTFQF